MFTGIIEDLGIVKKINPESITIQTKLPDVKPGDSIAVNGVCLTVVAVSARRSASSGQQSAISSFAADISEETLQRTNLGELTAGDKVNLERALKANSLLGGHIVLGHVETVGKITEIKVSGNSKIFSISIPKEISRYIVPKGSVAVDGISLTVIDIKPLTSYDHILTPQGKKSKGRSERENGWQGVANLQFTVAIIPHTLRNTTLGFKKPGDLVNIEPDILAKYAQRESTKSDEQTAESKITYQYLQEKGFI
ncbi:MAG: riboflavin synthase [Elusimicrobiota bacterium]|nr:riboflavin synthase [Elusimicrobiota bacterium]